MTTAPTFKTQRELLDAQREQLAERFRQKYPNGKFCIEQYPDNYWGLHWAPRRATACTRPFGVSTYFNPDPAAKNSEFKPYGIEQARWKRGPSWGRSASYDSFEKLLASCKKRGCPTELVEAFQKRYQNRHLEGFKA